MARPTNMDEYFVHQMPELLPEVATRSVTGGRATSSSCTARMARGDAIFFTMALSPLVDTWTRSRWAGSAASRCIGLLQPPDDERSAHHRRRRRPGRDRAPLRGGAAVRRPRRGAPSVSTSRSGLAPSRTGCGGARCAPATRSSGTRATSCSRAPTPAPTRVGGTDPRGRRVDRPARPLLGDPRPRPLPAVAVVPAPVRRRLPRRVALGATRTALASTPTGAGRAPTAATPCPLVDFEHDMEWIDADGVRARTASTASRSSGLRGRCLFTLEGGRRITVEAVGTFDRPYEPFHRGGLNQMRCRTDDGREGTAIYEITGARHHRYFPETTVAGVLAVVNAGLSIADTPTRSPRRGSRRRSARRAHSTRLRSPGSGRRGSGPGRCATASVSILQYDRPTTAPTTMVAKLPAADETSRATAKALGSYENEVRFYQQLAAGLPIRTPAVYYADIDVEYRQLRPAARRHGTGGSGRPAGRLHARTGEDRRRRARQAARSPMGRPDAHDRWTGCTATETLSRSSCSMLLPDAVGRLPRALRDRNSRPTSTKRASALFAHLEDYLQLPRPNRATIVHGDYRLDNLLFDPTAGGVPITVVDWQTCTHGSPLHDVAYFIGAGLHRRRPSTPTRSRSGAGLPRRTAAQRVRGLRLGQLLARLPARHVGRTDHGRGGQRCSSSAPSGATRCSSRWPAATPATRSTTTASRSLHPPAR